MSVTFAARSEEWKEEQMHLNTGDTVVEEVTAVSSGKESGRSLEEICVGVTQVSE